MKSRAQGVFTGLLLVLWLCLMGAVGSALAAITVAPGDVDLGTISLTPGKEVTLSVPVSITTDNSVNETDYVAGVDKPWLTVDPASGTLPGSATLKVTLNEFVDEGDHKATVTFTSNLGASDTVTVKVTVKRIIGNILTVSPTALEVDITSNDLSPRDFPVDIRNANPDKPDFQWSASSAAEWLSLAPVTGTGNATATLTIDPEHLPVTSDGNYAEGKITVLSSLSGPVEITVRARVVAGSKERLSVYPSYLHWSVERAVDGTLDTLDSETIFILSQNNGWIIQTDIPFITLTGELMGTGTKTSLTVQPNTLLAGYGYGRFTGNIIVSNLNGDATRIVPVTIDIRRPGEPVQMPMPPFAIYQSEPGYALVEATDAGWFEMYLAGPQVDRYTSSQACVTAGGVWADPDTIPGTLDEFCTLDEKVYVLLSCPDVLPGYVFAWSSHHPNGIGIVTRNGVRDPLADNWYYSLGSVPVIPFGPMRLLGFSGLINVSVRTGANLSSAQEIQRVQVNVRTPVGSWMVSENYQGVVYNYGSSRLLNLMRVPGSLDLAGDWGGTPVVCRPGDGTTYLYTVEFTEGGFYYVYEIDRLTGDKMNGRWLFQYGGQSSGWNTFEGTRVSNFLPLYWQP